jgi:GNAT superfamily N-acetyltransferase
MSAAPVRRKTPVTGVLRAAKTEDVPAMNHLRLQVRENILSDPGLVTESMVIEAITVTGRGWVFEDHDEILGFSIALVRDPSLWALFVLPECEGRGIGNALHEAAVTWLWSQGARSIWLSTDPGTRAEFFYRARGWRETGRLANGEVRLALLPNP